jgi:hypothetical protein
MTNYEVCRLGYAYSREYHENHNKIKKQAGQILFTVSLRDEEVRVKPRNVGFSIQNQYLLTKNLRVIVQSIGVCISFNVERFKTGGEIRRCPQDVARKGRMKLIAKGAYTAGMFLWHRHEIT